MPENLQDQMHTAWLRDAERERWIVRAQQALRHLNDQHRSSVIMVALDHLDEERARIVRRWD